MFGLISLLITLAIGAFIYVTYFGNAGGGLIPTKEESATYQDALDAAKDVANQMERSY